MSNIHTNKIERLSEAELRQLKRIYETDQSLQGSIMMRGINAELESRSYLVERNTGMYSGFDLRIQH